MTTTIVQAVFAGAAVVVAASVAATVLGRMSDAVARTLAAVLGVAATAAWVLFALEPGLERATAASGLTLCAIAELGMVVLAGAVARRRRVDRELESAEARLAQLIDAETERRSEDLGRMLARARADASSRLVEEERKAAAERLRLVAKREQQLRDELGQALSDARRRADERLSAWSADLEQMQQTLKSEAAHLGERQRQLLASVERKIEAEGRRLDAATGEQRATVIALRAELAAAAEHAVTAAKAELEEHSAERRRALHEVSERLRRRERELLEQIEHGEAEATQRIGSTFQDVERRQVDKLARIVEQTGQRYAEAAEQEFAAAIKAAREGAATRLSRELERASAMFVREAESVLAERLARVGDAGAQRLERRLGEAEKALTRRRDEILDGLERRLADAEADLRRRVEALESLTETERGLLEARLHELARRIDDAVAAAESRLRGPVRTP